MTVPPGVCTSIVTGMPPPPSGLPISLGAPGVQVRTLVGLRWIAIFGQLTTLAVVGVGLGFPLPLSSALAAVGASVVLNLGLSTLYSRNALLTGTEAALHFAFDLVQIGVLLLLTGGIANPFSLLVAVPVTIGATLLGSRAATQLASLAVLVLAGLWQFPLPLPWVGPEVVLPDLYRTGMFVAVSLSTVFLATYATRVSAESRQRARALVATQDALDRESRVSALGSLAAAAAHELGGPLGTITLIARELEDMLGDDPEFGDDIQLLGQEAKRSREILAGIARRAEAEHPFQRLPLDALLTEVAGGFSRAAVPVIVETLRGEPVMVERLPELMHGFANYVANAVRHAAARVSVVVTPGPDRVTVTVADDGPGYPLDLIPHLGEPSLGSRVEVHGLGLGLFIATNLLERTGARVSFGNADTGGALVTVTWARDRIDVGGTRGEGAR